MKHISFELFREFTIYYEQREPTRAEYEDYIKWQKDEHKRETRSLGHTVSGSMQHDEPR